MISKQPEKSQAAEELELGPTNARTLKFHLLKLSIGLLIPTVAFAGILLWQIAQSERARTEEEVRGISRSFAVALDREINGVLTTLQALATSPSLQSRDFESFYRQASTVSGLQGINISLRTLNARAIFTTRAPYGADVGVPPLLAQADQDLLRTGKAMVTNIFTSTIAGRPVFQILTEPVSLAGRPEYILGASIDVGYLADAIRKEHLPAGWIGSIIDRNDVFVARTEGHERLAGKSTSIDFRNRPTVEFGSYYGINSEGTPVLVGYATSVLTGWTAAASLPTRSVNAILRNSLVTLLLLGASLVLIAVASALFTGWQISHAFQRLVDMAKDVGASRIPFIAATRVSEVNDVQKAMQDAALQLESRAIALREINVNLEEKVVQRTQERNRIWETTADLVATAGFDGVLRAVNPAWQIGLGWSEDDLIAKSLAVFFDPLDRDALHRALEELIKTNAALVLSGGIIMKGGDRRSVMWSIVSDEVRRLIYFVGRDVTDHQRAEDALRQAQKMDAVGQLSGGIAHDFNNMLGVIMGSLNLLQRRISRGDTNVSKYIDGALDGATRAASLTQRLLAFSRQQPLAPKPVDANRMISEMADLLVRTLGERIRIETVLAAGLWRAKADPSQLENVIINMSVNARDAMPHGGKLTLETANIHLDETYARDHQVAAGQYVMISVSDTGTGMSPEVASKAFDPFFTTKGVGQGTGLGLSQVFGVARQSGGHVKIYSEVGHGTTLKLYLPRLLGDVPLMPEKRSSESIAGGRPGEIILIVEDEERVRNFSVEALRDLQYEVVHASDGAEALAILRSARDITLLFTDIVMPGMTGRALADAALEIYPDLKVLYTTGYSRNAIVHNGVLDPGTRLLTKPFGFDQLAVAVRAALDGER